MGMLLFAADALAHLDAVQAGHHHVEEHGVEGARLERREALAAVGRHGDREAVLVEVAREQLVEAGVVVDERARGWPSIRPGILALPRAKGLR